MFCTLLLALAVLKQELFKIWTVSSSILKVKSKFCSTLFVFFLAASVLISNLKQIYDYDYLEDFNFHHRLKEKQDPILQAGNFLNGALFSKLNTALGLLGIAGILLLPTALNAELNIGSMDQLLADLKTSVTEVLTQVTNLVNSVTTQLNAITTTLTTITTQLTTQATTLTAIQTAVNTLVAASGRKRKLDNLAHFNQSTVILHNQTDVELILSIQNKEEIKPWNHFACFI